MSISFHDPVWLLAAAAGSLHVLGFISAFDAVLTARSSQGAVAWSISLTTFPYLTVPLYWLFGRRRFRGYTEALRAFSRSRAKEIRSYRALVASFRADSVGIAAETERAYETIAGAEFLGGNAAELLIDGDTTFESIFTAIRSAERYVLVQFYIIRSDGLGNRLAEALLECAGRGVEVFVLYDEVGSLFLGRKYIRRLTDAGIHIVPFGTRRGFRNFFQLNFRNHRKIVVVDGRVGFVGGHNVGDEYLGLSKAYGKWRDTHLRLEGPGVLPLQETFFRDWGWATGEIPGCGWPKEPDRHGERRVLTIATGPADETERCVLVFLEAIRSAKSRVWISSPYFVPDDSIIDALRLAALRGVDVRILIPKIPDQLLVWLASFSYRAEIQEAGVRIFCYAKGFLHGKVLLADDALSIVGTANLDTRSLRLNFEVSTVVADPEFGGAVAEMFERDFQRSVEYVPKKNGPPWLLTVGSRIARLFSPIL